MALISKRDFISWTLAHSKLIDEAIINDDGYTLGDDRFYALPCACPNSFCLGWTMEYAPKLDEYLTSDKAPPALRAAWVEAIESGR